MEMNFSTQTSFDRFSISLNLNTRVKTQGFEKRKSKQETTVIFVNRITRKTEKRVTWAELLLKIIQ